MAVDTPLIDIAAIRRDALAKARDMYPDLPPNSLVIFVKAESFADDQLNAARQNLDAGPNGTSATNEDNKKDDQAVAATALHALAVVLPIVLGAVKLSAREYMEFVDDTRSMLKDRIHGATDAQLNEMTKFAVASVGAITNGQKNDREHLAGLTADSLGNAWNKRPGPTVEKAIIAAGNPSATAGLAFDQRKGLTNEIQQRLHPDPSALTIDGQTYKVDNPLLNAPAMDPLLSEAFHEHDKKLYSAGVGAMYQKPEIAGIGQDADGKTTIPTMVIKSPTPRRPSNKPTDLISLSGPTNAGSENAASGSSKLASNFNIIPQS